MGIVGATFHAGVGLGVGVDSEFCMISASPIYCEAYSTNHSSISKLLLQ